jgi:isopentenyl phosphate kinase
VLVKLGGSLITDKTRPGAARPAVIRRLARELAEVCAAEGAPHVVLGHGSGSFGHVAAERHGLAGGIAGGGTAPESVAGAVDRTRLAGIGETQARAAELHRLVIAELAAAGALPFSIAPSSALVAAGGRAAELSAEPAALALGLGLVPVVYGDVVLDREQGVAICSTERVLLALAERLPALGWRAERAFWLGATAGVLDEAGRPIEVISPAEPSSILAAAAAAGAAAGTDVTGGMRHRVDTALALARLGVESWILDGREPGALAAALTGRPASGTHVPRA